MAKNKKKSSAAVTNDKEIEKKADETKVNESDAVIADDEVKQTAEGESPSETDSENQSAEETQNSSIEKLKGLKNSFFDFMKRIGIPEAAMVRLIAAFFVISGMNLSSIKAKLVNGVEVNPITMWKDFVPLVNGTLTILLMAAVFIVLSAIYFYIPKKFRIIDQCSAIAAVLYFDVLLLWRAGDFNLSFGTMMVSVVLIYYSVGQIRSHKLLNKVPWWIYGLVVLASAIAVGIFIGITTVCRHYNFGTACHDFGLFVQMYHSLIDNGTAVTTCERDTFMSHFKIHASYIFYVLVPSFKMFPKPETLLISQAVLAMGGIIPMFLIAKRHNFKGLSLAFMGFAYVFSIGLVAPCYYEFHENAFLPTILMWLLWAVDRKNYVMFYIMSVLTCIVKEDAPLYVICIGMYLFFEDKGRLARVNGLIMALFAGSYMLFITNWLTKNGDGQMMMSSRFSILMIDSTGGLKEVVKNSLSDPAYLFSLLVRDDTTRFFLQVMVPMLFVPFFTRKIRRFLLMLPFTVMNLIIGAGYGYAANVGFQYIFGPICLLLYMCIINIDDMGQRGKQSVPVAFGAAAIIMTIGTVSQNWGNYVGYQNSKDYFVSLNQLLDSIPKDASVGTDTFYVAHIADHKEVYLFDSNDYYDDNTLLTPERFDFVALPVQNDSFERSSEVLIANGYMLWAEIPNKCQVFKSPSYVPES